MLYESGRGRADPRRSRGLSGGVAFARKIGRTACTANGATAKTLEIALTKEVHFNRGVNGDEARDREQIERIVGDVTARDVNVGVSCYPVVKPPRAQRHAAGKSPIAAKSAGGREIDHAVRKHAGPERQLSPIAQQFQKCTRRFANANL